MLRNVKELRSYALYAKDGVIGEVDDLYFDDEDWAVRYFVVDTGHWLSGRKVLISPLAIGQPDWMGQQLPVTLTKAQVEHSPDIDTQKPVSRQHEAAYLQYYGYPYYWGGGGLWGASTGTAQDEPTTGRTVKRRPTTGRAVKRRPKTGRTSAKKTADDCHLRSCRAVIGHHIHATDGEIGHVQDLLVDDADWAIRYLVVNTSHWWGDHEVLIAPRWIEDVRWPEAVVSVGLTRQAIKDAPAYDAAAQLDREHEQGMYVHYGRPGYWTSEALD
ncbi:MAG TPA: PRC-barrel domain-containing protein [Vicinamibacterales bacterium]|nr:PRC-barrel domain-containing protein [Vicinamibacterales bacterium]